MILLIELLLQVTRFCLKFTTVVTQHITRGEDFIVTIGQGSLGEFVEKVPTWGHTFRRHENGFTSWKY